jgi:3(or 17)beta-hydroxysteroid dehydrogenase
VGEQTFVCRAGNVGTNDVEAARQMAVLRHPIGRLGVPDDIAKGIVFVTSDDAGFPTGARGRDRRRVDRTVSTAPAVKAARRR